MSAGCRAGTSRHAKDAATILDASASATPTLVGGAKVPLTTPCWPAPACRHTSCQSPVPPHFQLKSAGICWPAKTVTGIVKEQHDASVLVGQIIAA